MLAPPRHSTPRTLTRPTDASAASAIAATLRRPWMPHQRLVAAVASETNPDGSYAYHTVVVQMPRQCGKTTTAYDVAMGRGRRYADHRVRYSTHKGTITSDRFEDWFLELERAPKAIQALIRTRRSHGTESIAWKATGSYWKAFPSRDGALRSAALDMVVNDEAQWYGAEAGQALNRTVIPTMDTRLRGQLWILMTAGDPSAVYAADYLKRGLAGEPGVAVFDFGCPPDIDPLNPDRWHQWHPGLAHGRTRPQALHRALGLGEDTFIQEYGCIWSEGTGTALIPSAEWVAATHAPSPVSGQLALGVDVDGDTGAIVAADRNGCAEVLTVGPRPALLERVRQLVTRWHPTAVGIAGTGAPSALADQLRRSDLFDLHAGRDPLTRGRTPLLVMNTTDQANATAFLLEDLHDRAIRVWPSDYLSAAVSTVATRGVGDGAVVFHRRTSAAPIATLVGLAAARWALTHAPRVLPAPVVHAG